MTSLLSLRWYLSANKHSSPGLPALSSEHLYTAWVYLKTKLCCTARRHPADSVWCCFRYILPLFDSLSLTSEPRVRKSKTRWRDGATFIAEYGDLDTVPVHCRGCCSRSGVLWFNTRCCSLSGTRLPIKQICFPSSPGAGLSGSFDCPRLLISMCISLLFSTEGENLGPTQDAYRTPELYTSRQTGK